MEEQLGRSVWEGETGEKPKVVLEAQGLTDTDIAEVGGAVSGGVGDIQGGFWKPKVLVDMDSAGVGGGVGETQGGNVETEVAFGSSRFS